MTSILIIITIIILIFIIIIVIINIIITISILMRHNTGAGRKKAGKHVYKRGHRKRKSKKLKSMNQEDEHEDIKGTEHAFSILMRSLTKICLKIQVSQGLYYSRSQVLRSAELIQRLPEKKEYILQFFCVTSCLCQDTARG